MKLTDKILLTFIFITYCYAVASAQRVSGYLGKRTFVGTSIVYIPNVFRFGNSSAGIDYRNISKFYMLNSLKYGLSVGYALNNDKSLIVDLDYQRLGLLDNTASEIRGSYDPLDFLYARSTAIGLKVKVQNSVQFCAPIGAYKGLSFGLHQYNNSYLNTQKEEKYFSPVYDASIGFTGGVRRVYKDKFMLDLGVDLNLHIRLIGSMLMADDDIEKIAKKYAIRKNGYNNILSCKAALYYLL
jgi:hypothetical protein